MAEDEALIEAVRGFECLWKVRAKAYKDLRAKENAWTRVAEEVIKIIYILLGKPCCACLYCRLVRLM